MSLDPRVGSCDLCAALHRLPRGLIHLLASALTSPFLRIETLEQLAAVVVTAGLVIGNFLMFTPWRDGQDPRHRPPAPAPTSSLLERPFTQSFLRALN